MSNTDSTRRGFFRWLGGAAALLGASQVKAHHTETHFGDSTAHKVVYQCNKADPDYITHILFSAGELMRKYGDDIEIVVTVFGPGIHLLAKHPLHPLPPELHQKAASLAAYGVSFHACGNTLSALHWTEKDLFEFAKLVPIGAEDMMLLQEKGFSYISW